MQERTASPGILGSVTAATARTASGLDLDAYLERIGYRGTPRADIETLVALHEAHAGAIPFENLIIQMGGIPSLEIDDLQTKLVTAGAGGYCFEQNTFFQAVLQELGFEVTAREARVMLTISARRPRTHMALEVVAEGERYHADVGFGANGPLLPIPLDNNEHQQHDRQFRFERRGSVNVLQGHSGRRWLDLVGIEDGEPQPVDFEVANWFTATHPRSVFQTNLMADLQNAHERHRLQNRNYSRIVDGVAEDRRLEVSEIPALLRDVFKLDVPDDARFVAFERHDR